MATVDLEFELKLIRETLHLSAADTARLFGVTRSTVCSWQSGQPISSVNAERLHEIVQALEPHLPILQTQSGRLAHRAIAGRSTLLDLLAQGSPAQQVVDQLAELLAQEAVQRERLARRLQGRDGSCGAADLDAFS
jgi:transcriptional regulator with XRE-family HTH domain